jgi:hypothetical protein
MHAAIILEALNGQGATVQRADRGNDGFGRTGQTVGTSEQRREGLEIEPGRRPFDAEQRGSVFRLLSLFGQR